MAASARRKASRAPDVRSAPSRLSSTADAPPAFRSPERVWFAVVLIVLALPRIARMLYPQVWIEDESYLNGAFLLSRGFAPYRDFALPHLPLLEGLLALAFKAAPVSIRTAEAFTAIAAFAASAFVYQIGTRLGGRATGVAAGVIFATSSVLFRYHVFEREVFDIVPVLAAVWIVLSRTNDSGAATQGRPYKSDHAGGRSSESGHAQARPDEFRDARPYAIAGLLLALAMAIKLTAVAALVALVAQLAMTRRVRDALIVGATALGAIALLTIALAVAFGRAFAVQVIVFRAVHASFPSLTVKLDEMRYTLDVALASGVAGVVFLAWTARLRAYAAPLVQLASGVVFLVLLNPTYWAHTGIELLPWLAICGGALFGAPAARADRRNPVARRPAFSAATACAVLTVLLIVWVMPIKNLNWQAGDGSVYGFGYRDRSEIAAAAAVVREHTPEADLVATPPIIAFAANRREIVPYAELAGDMADLTDAVERDGYVHAITGSPLRSRTFWEGVEASRERIAPLIDEAVRARRLGAVINFSEDDLFPIPLVSVDQPALEGAGYRLASMTGHYEVWVRQDTGGAPR